MSTQHITFSNPRLRAEFSDWPIGGSRRGKCVFNIEHKAGKGHRLTRVTENPKTGGWYKPQVNTYGGEAAIVDGSDGRTYVLQRAQGYSFIYIWRSDLFQGGTVHPSEDRVRFDTLNALIEEANKPPFDHVGFIIDLEDGKLDDEKIITGIQALIDNGVINHLQGSYQRLAARLIETGECHPSK